MPSTGRPKRLDENGKAEVCHLVERGLSIAAAARLLGCAPNTIRNTAVRDPAFQKELQDARRTFELKSLGKIRRTARSPRVRMQAADVEDRRKRGRRYRRPDPKLALQMEEAVRALFAAQCPELNEE